MAVLKAASTPFERFGRNAHNSLTRPYVFSHHSTSANSRANPHTKILENLSACSHQHSIFQENSARDIRSRIENSSSSYPRLVSNCAGKIHHRKGFDINIDCANHTGANNNSFSYLATLPI